MYMHRYQINARNFRDWQKRAMLSNDMELGYSVHTFLRRNLGDESPRSFRVYRGNITSPSFSVVGYMSDDYYKSPRGYLCVVEEHDARKIDIPAIGDNVYFETRLAPLYRLNGREFDVAEHPDVDPEAGHKEIYRDWALKKLSEFMDVKSMDVLSHGKSVVVRKTTNKDGPSSRNACSFPIPFVSVKGTGMITAGSDKMTDVALSGIGRHCAFGFGTFLFKKQ